MAGRPTMIPTVRKCLAYAKQHDGVWFARRKDIAQWSLEHEKAKA
jgi:allantoinase